MIHHWWLLAMAVLWLAAPAASAHKPSDSYLSLTVDGGTVAGQWDIALRDLDYAIGLDDNADGRLTWGEVRAHRRAIADYALSRLAVSGDGAPCPIEETGLQIDQHSDGGYVVLRFGAACKSAIGTLGLRYDLFFDLDPQHRGLLNLMRDGVSTTAVFAPDRRAIDVAASPESRIGQFGDYLREGVHHIWTGYDHILFLLALLLPSVLRRTDTGWVPASSLGAALSTVVKTVTAFTVAHSITLSCAVLGVISVPSRLVESAIAASVVLAALNNIYPLFRDRTWPIAFCFGLVHGLGFANVLFELGLPRQTLYLALIGFNLGVELGQLAIVALFLPIAFRLRPFPVYRQLVLAGGSTSIMLLASAWFVERAFAVSIV